MVVPVVAQIGGIFALLTLAHFVADWVFQSHAEAMAKPKNSGVRARHCTVYAVLCCLVIGLFQPDPYVLGTAWLLLFCSHYLEDTYLPVFVWAKYIRKPPEMTAKATLEEFVAFAATPIGKILLIAIDQIVHILFLVPIAAMIVLPSTVLYAGLVGVAAIGGLAYLCSLGRRQ